MGLGSKLCLPMVVVLVACGGGREQPAPPQPIVDVVMLTPETVPNIIELPGRIEAVRSAEVRARTDGIVLRRLYEEGETVAAGAPLFQLDPRDYRAQVAQSQAGLQRYEATRANAAALVRRYTPLAEQRAVSAQEFDAARSDLAQAEAQVAEARATLARSQLQLGYTTIRAPIAGVAGRAEVTEGALVTSAQSVKMTQVDQISPVYAVFSASSTSILDMIRNIRTGVVRVPGKTLSAIHVRLLLENGEDYGPSGTLDFTAPVVDPNTGSQLVRARIANDGRLLKPGQFVTGRIETGVIENGIVIPARAVQMKGEQASVALLGPDGTVISQPVQLGQMLKRGWIVQSGLKKGDRLIVDGWQKARPGQKAVARGDQAAETPTAPAKGR